MAARPVSTPEGAQALRRIACSAAWGERNPIEARRWLQPALVEALPLALAQAQAALAPSLGRDFKRWVAPSLALVAPVSMSEDDQTAWLATAAETLSGIPSDLLEIGCMKARQRADHPSKLVAAIFAEIGAAWEMRKRDLRNAQRLADIVASTGEPVPADRHIEQGPISIGEIAKMMPELHTMGLRAGWITQEQIDEAAAWQQQVVTDGARG
jgi:hypothetical protein